MTETKMENTENKAGRPDKLPSVSISGNSNVISSITGDNNTVTNGYSEAFVLRLVDIIDRQREEISRLYEQLNKCRFPGEA